jgi:hypothetical protein
MAICSMSNEANFFTLLDDLIDGWCERRALNPLRYILPAYPPAKGLTDEWRRLYDAVRDIRALSKGELDAWECERLNRAIVGVQNVLGK